jgi:hypothetical protein
MAEPGFFDRIMLAGLGATVEGLFPENDVGAPDWKATELVPRTLEYFQLLPPPQRRLLWVLFFAVELLAPALMPGFRRFSRHSPRQRASAVRRWRRSPFFLLRVLGDALKASITMMYMSHPRVLAHIEERRTCVPAREVSE